MGLIYVANYYSKYVKIFMHSILLSPLDNSADLIFRSCTYITMFLIGPVESKITFVLEKTILKSLWQLLLSFKIKIIEIKFKFSHFSYGLGSKALNQIKARYFSFSPVLRLKWKKKKVVTGYQHYCILQETHTIKLGSYGPTSY